MKLLKLIFFIQTIIVLNTNLYSNSLNYSGKNNLLIYNFLTTDNYNDIKDYKENHQFYSTIIPESITKNLQNSGKYKIHREAGPFSIETDLKNKTEKEKYINTLKDLSFKHKSDYIITGFFNVINMKLTLQVIIFNATSEDIKIIDQESSELGVQFTETTDLVSQKINEYIKNIDIQNEKKLKKSPFMSLYRPFSIITTGVDGGYVFIFGKWASVYNNSLYFAPFIDIDLSEHFSLSLKYNSIQSDSENKHTSTYSQIHIKSGDISLCYTRMFNTFIGISISAGGGMTSTTITLNPEKPFVSSLAEKKSTDPDIDISTYIIYNLSSLTLKTGVLYKRIFLKNESMDIGVCFAGAGVNF